MILKLPTKQNKLQSGMDLQVELIEMENVSLGQAVFTPDEQGNFPCLLFVE